MSETDPSEMRESRIRWGGVSTWTAVIGTILAIIGTVIAVEQAHLADVTSRASERQALATREAADQQALVGLVGQIADLSRSLPSTPATEVAQVHQEMAVDAEQGLALEGDLHGRMPAIDNLELGVGFEPSGEFRLALLSFTRAGADATDPFYRSRALRAAAAILYVLGGQSNLNAARNDTSVAYHALDGQSDVPRVEIDQNHDLVDLWDAYWNVGSDCPGGLTRAAGEVRNAEQIINRDPGSKDTAVQEYLTRASAEVASCRAGSPIRLKYPPTVPVS